MTRADLLDFATRDWDGVAWSKAAHWMEMRAEYGAEEVLRVADGLRRQCQELHPDWPDEEDRQADLKTHARVAAALHHAAKTGRS